MSVICQNFVQNAWKKDLCSNCFKSVGDHESINTLEDAEISSINKNESIKGRCPQPSRNEAPAPHTTWKSLISERNGKNAQPFKLENGFQGRLLTINKALNGTDKQSANESNLKDRLKGQCVGNKITGKMLNGEQKQAIKNENSPVKLNHTNKNGSVIKSGAKLSNGKCPESKSANSDVTKVGNISAMAKQNAEKVTDDNIKKEAISNKKQIHTKFTKGKNEETTHVTPNLHSILKKTTSSQSDNICQTRRSSNVGFKDEEPLVIGYGGRDFTPEELEWEMASSDGETENASDSLDETEDDKVFSKMTKQNTEFNSDNANLLENNNEIQKILPNSSNCKTIETQNDIDSRSDISPEKKEAQNNCTESKVNSKSDTVKNAKNSQMEQKRNNENKNYINGDTNDVERDVSDIIDKTVNCESKIKSASTVGENGTEITSSEIKSETDSINVAIKSDNKSHMAKINGVTVVETTEAADSKVEVKNNSEFINGATPPIPRVGARSKTESEKTADAVMFSDGEQTWQENSEGRTNDWQDEDPIPGQILQAINTSLTNRHKMRENPDSNTGVEEERTDSQQNDDTQNEINKVSLSISNEKSDIRDVAEENGEESNEEQEEISLTVEPRESFLHGISKPSAIYGPASDLFVSRSNSSSSSSSDEMRKSQISLSINVIVNGDDSHNSSENGQSEETVSNNESLKTTKECTENTYTKVKPDIPAKPTKQVTAMKKGHDPYSSKTELKESLSLKVERENEDGIMYYSTIPDSSRTTINLVDPYAESNIYHEVSEKDLIKMQENEQTPKIPGRESKLAALAMELEQVRHCNTSTKRQAPAPPKVPDPPLEDPPSCTGRTSPISEISHNFSTFRGESMGFSSASSTTSTSSQDTETGYASWNLHGDSDEQPKHSKSKSSFLLTQYSKCKMLAMGYAEDSARARKKFSIKKLLKIGKETETPITFDPNCPNPKAWKYSDHFERPRAKLEIIHPMDLENKSVTVNPGFDSLHSGSLSSFSANADDTSFRNSISSDYGSYYSDTLSPSQDLKQEANYDYIQPHLSITEEQEDLSSKAGTSSSTSPTPSRSSTASQASTVTSGSSKNAVPPHRPPKPPPPPRAHSLLPGNKTHRNSDGTFKFPFTNGDTSSSDEVTISPPKPQAPKRQCKSALIRTEYTNLEEQISINTTQKDASSSNQGSPKSANQDENRSNKRASIQINLTENQTSCNQEDDPQSIMLETKDAMFSSLLQNSEINEDTSPLNTSSVEGTYDNIVSEDNGNKVQASITIKTNSTQKDKLTKSMLSRNKHPPLTKSPARPPPIYSKPQTGNFSKNTQPWKTLEDSYQALTSSNRELLIKIVNQALKKRKHLMSKINKVQFQWMDFEIDTNQTPSVFGFGEKIAYQATMPTHPEYELTLVISIQQQQSRLQENSEIKYPLFGRFTDYIPSEILDSSGDGELETVLATILVLDRSSISTIECFSENLSESLTEENEKELCFIILQLIQSLKSLQAQGIESIDTNLQNLLLTKSKQDKYHTLIFLYDICYDENDYASDSCKISLCQYTLMLLFQILKIQTTDDSDLTSKFSSHMSRKVFETAFSLLSEEKAVSLSQTKTLFECYLWGVTKILENLKNCDDCDSILHRWLDIERSNCMKSIIGDEMFMDLNVQTEYYSQFLIRSNVRNIKEITSLL